MNGTRTRSRLWVIEASPPLSISTWPPRISFSFLPSTFTSFISLSQKQDFSLFQEHHFSSVQGSSHFLLPSKLSFLRKTWFLQKTSSLHKIYLSSYSQKKFTCIHKTSHSYTNLHLHTSQFSFTSDLLHSNTRNQVISLVQELLNPPTWEQVISPTEEQSFLMSKTSHSSQTRATHLSSSLQKELYLFLEKNNNLLLSYINTIDLFRRQHWRSCLLHKNKINPLWKINSVS